MKRARLLVLLVAIAAGGLALILAGGNSRRTVTTAQQAAPPIATIDVLVVRGDVRIGQSIHAGDLAWQAWPVSAANAAFIRRTDRPDAIERLAGSIARGPFYAGEPVRDGRLIRADGSGFMAAILPSGFRAVATEIAPETASGGFILPNDRVDVILTRRDLEQQRVSGFDVWTTETILQAVRVLAIDQQVEEKNGEKVVVGRTATLELSPRQAETLVLARQMGTLSLALRSIIDANALIVDEEETRRDSIRVIRFGVPTTSAAR